MGKFLGIFGLGGGGGWVDGWVGGFILTWGGWVTLPPIVYAGVPSQRPGHGFRRKALEEFWGML